MKKLIHMDALIFSAMLLIIFSSLVGVSIPLVLKESIDQKSGISGRYGLLLLTLFLTQAALVTLGQYLMARSGERQVQNIREKLANHLLYAPKIFLDHQKSGDLSSRVMSDTNNIRIFLTTNVATFTAGIVTIVGSLIALFSLDWQLSLVLVACFPFVALVTIPITNLSENYATNLQTDTANTTGFLTETFRKSVLIKANSAEKTMQHTAKDNFNSLFKVALKSDLVEAIASPLVLLFLFGSVAVIFAYGGQRVSNGTLSVGTLMSFLIYLFQLLNPISSISEFLAARAKLKGSTTKISQLLQAPQELFDTGSKPLPGDLALINASFSYGKVPVLDNVSLTFEKNRKTAIVGPSGGGKSTIVNLLERFYPLDQGQLTLSGVDSESVELNSWRQNFALVDQNSDIISGTIRDNLLFGLKDTYSSANIDHVLQEVGLKKEIDNLPSGLDSYVGEDGGLLSGGQRQRLQIARAYLRSPRFIIFDEATANLDADAEYLVTKSLNNLLDQRTAIIIAHRLSTIVDADIIYFLEGRHITGRGTHAELMATHDSYRRFVNEQVIEN